MQEDPYQMIRYFSDFLTEVNLIITGIKQSVYEIIDVHLSIQTGKSVQRSMSSIILATHKTFDDLKKIESVLTGVVKSKRIIVNQQYNSSFKKRSKTTYSRLELGQQEKINSKEKAEQELSKTNCAKTVKRGLVGRQQIKQQFERSRSSEEEDGQRTTNRNMGKHGEIKTNRNVTERGTQHPASQVVSLKSCKSQENIRSFIKCNDSNLSKILQTNNECLRIVRSAKKDLKKK